MARFFLTQCKRLWRYLPVALCVTALLLGGLAVAVQGLLTHTANDEEHKKIQIAIAGQTDHSLLQMGFAALTSFDSTRFSMEVLQMTEPEAETALRQGELSAYVVVPEGFVEKAMRGELTPLKFVTNTAAGDLVDLFKSEITRVVSDLVVLAQQGVFGMGDALREHGLTAKLPGQMDKLAFQYVDYILLRDKIYAVEELGVADSLSLGDSLVCGLGVLLVLLMALPFAPVTVTADMALNRMLHARRLSATRQVLAECAAYALTLFLMAALPVLVAVCLFPNGLAVSAPEAVLRLMPAVLMLATLSFALYSLTSHLIGGVLAHFFATLALCFVSGCLYPVHFFPVAVQQVAGYLPTGLARTQLAGCFTGADTTAATLLLLGYAGLFLLTAMALRLRRIKGVSE